MSSPEVQICIHICIRCRQVFTGVIAAKGWLHDYSSFKLCFQRGRWAKTLTLFWNDQVNSRKPVLNAKRSLPPVRTSDVTLTTFMRSDKVYSLR